MNYMRKRLLNAVVVVACFLASAAHAQDPSAGVIFEDVRIFNGTSGQLSAPSNVLVAGNVIRTISIAPIADPAGMTVLRIRGNGRTLMPGLIDNHWHTMLARPSPAQAIGGDVGYLNLLAGAEANATLMRGFTTVRDLGGPSFGLKQAIDEGLLPGPRIYPSGAMITITGGHGDFRSPSELPRQFGGPLSRMEVINGSHGGRFARRGARSRARAALARGLADQADGGRRRRVAAQSARRFHLHRGRIAGRGPGRGKLGNLRHRARVYAGRHPARDRGGRQGHRARPPDGRADRRADGREGHLAELPAVHGRRGRPAPGARQPRPAVAGVRRHGEHGRAGEEVQAQDGVRHRRAVLAGVRRPCRARSSSRCASGTAHRSCS